MLEFFSSIFFSLLEVVSEHILYCPVQIVRNECNKIKMMLFYMVSKDNHCKYVRADLINRNCFPVVS